MESAPNRPSPMSQLLSCKPLVSVFVSTEFPLPICPSYTKTLGSCVSFQGKSLSVICSALQWLKDAEARDVDGQTAPDGGAKNGKLPVVFSA